MENNQIIIYENDNNVQLKYQSETLWANLNQISMLFNKEKSNISRHIKNIFAEGELSEDAVVAKNATTASDGKTYQVNYYNLDMILSIGYRVNSKRATAFRKWATNVLKKYLTDGYAINDNRLLLMQDKLKMLIQSVNLMKNTAENQISDLNPTVRELMRITSDFVSGFDVLDSYDHEQLNDVGLNKVPAKQITTDEFLTEIKKMTSRFGGLFGVLRDDSFQSSIAMIYQSVNGIDAYPSIEEKASTLLYLVTKNHSFVDGNKRIAAFCFLYFLGRNNLLFINGKKIIDDATLATMTLLVAQSDPREMNTIKKIIITILNNGQE